MQALRHKGKAISGFVRTQYDNHFIVGFCGICSHDKTSIVQINKYIPIQKAEGIGARETDQTKASFWRTVSVVQPLSHLQCEDADDRLVVTDAVLHDACVQVLSDLQRVLLILLHLVDLLCVQIKPVFILHVRGRGFGS